MNFKRWAFSSRDFSTGGGSAQTGPVMPKKAVRIIRTRIANRLVMIRRLPFCSLSHHKRHIWLAAILHL